ncbi:Uma2 family endonuclease [Pseudanabaena sp. PCC 6802]|uniref:Uma2 family endonuclease n=1 Tax=Pseudanabaena sp. PCC 6802 TaxID=118173 RepID=UPI00034BE780|nr:Uma2 family endonuclease [Pseudanabaena sp. PCC 6802]
MTTQTLPQVELSGISWQTYETLLDELRDRRLRLTYYHGNLEIMAPLPEHEFYKKVVGRFVETLAEELEIKIVPLGSTTFKLPEAIGAEPDECFYIKNLRAIQGKKRLDLDLDPPPDLVVEIDITSGSRNRFAIYADMGVPEIWRYNGQTFTIYQLRDRAYIACTQSLAFPNLPLLEIQSFLEQATTADYLDLIGAFRQWVKNQI